MNIQEYLSNPAGKGAVIPGKNALLDVYNARYKNLINRKQIKVNVYTINDDIVYHLLIPTESDKRENDYDIVLKFSPLSKNDRMDASVKNNIKKYEMYMFSNCPSFTYTYAYTANLNGVLIQELKNRYDDKIIKNPPISRNPSLILNYEKSIYFACKFILENNCLTMTYIKNNSKKLTKNAMNEIRNNNQIEEEIQRAKAVHKEQNKNKTVDITRPKITSYGKSEHKSDSSVNYIQKNTGSKGGNIGKIPKKKGSKSTAKKSSVSYIKKR